MSSALFEESNTILNAVASFLGRQHHENKHQDQNISSNTPLLVLTNMPGKDSLLANVIMGKLHDKSRTLNNTEATSFEQVHALATANLVATTQQIIAKQLEEEDSLSCQQPKLNSQFRKQKVLQGVAEPKVKKNTKPAPGNKLSGKSENTADAGTLQKGIEPKILVCSFEGCSRKFSGPNHLKYHKLTHTNNRQFKCPDESCGKNFFTAQQLKVHLRTHTGEKPFKCNHQGCNKTFTTVGNFKNHLRIHTGEQPYVCDVANCNKRFTELSSLRKHELTHSGDKPFECDICGKKFTQSSSRRQHLLRHQLSDEIKNSYRQNAKRNEEKEEDQVMIKKDLDDKNIQNLQEETHALEVTCSPQVLVLNSGYQAVTSQSVVPVQQMDSSDNLSFSHTLLHSDGLDDKAEELIILSEAPIYQPNDNHSDIVYTSDMLDHEEVTHTGYVSSQVDYSAISHTNFSNHEEIINSDDFNSQDITHPEHYAGNNDDIAITEYVTTDCISNYTGSRELAHTYLDSEGNIVHTSFIGAEEIAVAHYADSPDDKNSISVDVVSLLDISKENAKPDIVIKKEVLNSTGISSFPEHSSSSSVSSHSTDTLRQSDREIHMDPMMECDEEPEKTKPDIVIKEEVLDSTGISSFSEHSSNISYLSSSSGSVSSHSTDTLRQSDIEIHMDPMMECDEEPEKS
ncbi:zinc finger and BTB domain-containing protein 24-like isoform X2 [Physella acuta]|uniref:zinc finger and BTB domain-containing protein 24-like isoform X2 n=1 Tax=Physella acuta TaxID=109671 RepID=UPI0027DC8E52|nr:zinc finger and BTB domain-containing protein 24-like isoform X2 [Physella acuta]